MDVRSVGVVGSGDKALGTRLRSVGRPGAISQWNARYFFPALFAVILATPMSPPPPLSPHCSFWTATPLNASNLVVGRHVTSWTFWIFLKITSIFVLYFSGVWAKCYHAILFILSPQRLNLMQIKHMSWRTVFD